MENPALTLPSYLPLFKSILFSLMLHSNNNVIIRAEFRLQSSFWTSASSEGEFCASERTFAWCTSGSIFNESSVNDAILWTVIPTGNESTSNCVSLGLSKNEGSAQLSLAACSESKPFMCQVLLQEIKQFIQCFTEIFE
jgi:hypothetical protein